MSIRPFDKMKIEYWSNYSIPCILVGGRGLKGMEGLSLLNMLGETLQVPVAATRGAVEEGWFPAEKMIGFSGIRIRTDIYVGIGVSGSNFHTAGIRGEPMIIAVNPDPRARIHELAHYSCYADAKAVLSRQLDFWRKVPEKELCVKNPELFLEGWIDAQQ